jgi:gliding-associated putative ABC transporter substrate-binding component GldG
MSYAFHVMQDNLKKKINKVDTSITALFLIGIIIVVNFLSYQMFFRWDLTANKVYSISKVSKNTVGELDDIVNIKAYFSENLPAQLFSLRQEVEDILDEYQNYSNGKIKIEYIDPNDDEETQRELYGIGIPQLTFEVYEKDKRELVNGYMGIAIQYGDNTETIPAVKQNTSDLEYQLTTAIKKVISDEIAVIGILSSNGSANLENDLSFAHKELAGLYDVLSVDLSGEEAQIPGQIKTLIIPAPKEKFTEAQTEALKNFVDGGGSILALIDGVLIGEGLTASKNDLALNSFFNEYGITLNTDLVGDTRSGTASFSQGFLTFSSAYSFWPKITKEGFNQEYNAVANFSKDKLFDKAVIRTVASSQDAYICFQGNGSGKEGTCGAAHSESVFS